MTIEADHRCSPNGWRIARAGRRLRRAVGFGFTLIEIMLAVAICSIVLLAMHLVFYGAVRLRNNTTATLEAAAPLQQTLTIIQRDLESLVPPGGGFSNVFQTTPVAGSMQSQGNPTFCTAVGVLDISSPWAEVQKVTYNLAAPTNNTVGKDLFRSVSRNPLPTIQNEWEDQWLMGGVDSIAFQFYDGSQWRDTWDSTTGDAALPGAIRVQIFLASAGNERFHRNPIELLVPVVVQVRTNQVAQASGDQQ